MMVFIIKIRENKIAYIKDQIQAIEEWKNMKSPEFYNNVGVDYPELEKEKWDVDMDKVRKEADEAIKKFYDNNNKIFQKNEKSKNSINKL